MIWIEDLTYLEPHYLRTFFRPQDNGLSVDDLVAAICSVTSSTREYLLKHIEPQISDTLHKALKSRTNISEEEVFAAQLRVIGIYFWEVVYRKHPDVYELFSQSQIFPFDELFPAAHYEGAVVLDAGCGTGKLVGHLVQVVNHIYGIDPAEPMLKIAQSKFANNQAVTFLKGTFRDVPLPDESVDFVVSNMAFQCTEERGGEIGLSTLKRVLKPGGEIRIVVANSRCQDFLLDHGFVEDFAAGELQWNPPPPESSTLLLECLYDLSKNLSSLQTQANSESLAPRYLFCPSSWRPYWTQKALIKLVEGAPVERLFHQGDYFSPLGVPVYLWVKL